MAEPAGADVVIVGSGGAALRAALAADDAGASTLVLTKGELGKAGVTALACSDRMAFHATLEHTEPGGPDAWRYHAEDIYRIGGRVSDASLARILAQGACEAFHYLDRLGVPFVKNDHGLADQFVTDGSKFARACYTGPYTANHIHEALRNEFKRRRLAILENVMATDLALDASGRVAAVRLADARNLKSEISNQRTIAAGAVVLATGGAGQVFQINVFPEGMTGDGHAMAYRAGAELVNLEFIQIGLSSVKTNLACSGSLMRALPRLVTEDDREFLFDYFPDGASPERIYAVLFKKGASWPLSYRDESHVIDIAVFSEMQNGHTVSMDFSKNPERLDTSKLDPALWSKYPKIAALPLTEPPLATSPLERLKAINLPSVAWLAERGVDLEKGDRIELAPACQHFQGGVKINERAETTVPGLFACGEVAGGQHGANRPGGNALMDSQVMGRIAGEQAAALATASKPGESVETAAEKADTRGEAIDVREVRSTIQHLMTMRASVKRTAAGVKDGLEKLAQLKARPWDGREAGDAFLAETRSIAQVAEMVLAACGARTESRGPHLYFESPEAVEPLPRRDPDWRKSLVIHRAGDGCMVIEQRRPVEPDWELVQQIEDA